MASTIRFILAPRDKGHKEALDCQTRACQFKLNDAKEEWDSHLRKNLSKNKYKIDIVDLSVILFIF